MSTLIEYAKQDRYEDVLGLGFNASSKEIDSKKITLAYKYSSDSNAKMAINKAASMLKSELQDRSKKLFLHRIRRIGYSLYKGNNYSDSLRYLNQAVIEGGNENDYLGKVLVLIQTGKHLDAYNCVKECAKKYPRSEAAKLVRQIGKSKSGFNAISSSNRVNYSALKVFIRLLIGLATAAILLFFFVF